MGNPGHAPEPAVYGCALGAGAEPESVLLPARLFVFGGEPFDEPLVMWWNFVGRSHEEIVQARTDWMQGTRFGTVTDCAHDPLPTPRMPTVSLKARPARANGRPMTLGTR